MQEKIAWEGEVVNVASLAGRVSALEAWQKRQNGSIQRIEEKVDRLMWLHYTEMAAVIGSAAGVIYFLACRLGV
jgi:hypothetical protein